MLKALITKAVPNKTTGDHAEGIAKKYLQDQGLHFVEQNYHSRMGEIDLIFKESSNTLLFIEVKYRSDTQFGHADEMVTIHKQKKIIKTARAYLQEKKLTESVIARFDVIAIEPQQTDSMNKNHSPLSIRWIKHAFETL